jgi:hypothetical protein
MILFLTVWGPSVDFSDILNVLDSSTRLLMLFSMLLAILSLLTRCFSVVSSLEANERFLLRGMMGENGILWPILC